MFAFDINPVGLLAPNSSGVKRISNIAFVNDAKDPWVGTLFITSGSIT